MGTDVILTAEIEHLGEPGEAVTVADGYARNFLVPRGLAIMATAGNLKRIEALRKKREAEQAAKHDAAQAIVDKLSKLTCTVSAPVGADGKMFGAVTAADIAENLKAQGFEVDRRKIVLEHPIRHVGDVEVQVKLHADVTATVKVSVVSRAGNAADKAAAIAAEEKPVAKKPAKKTKKKPAEEKKA